MNVLIYEDSFFAKMFLQNDILINNIKNFLLKNHRVLGYF